MKEVNNVEKKYAFYAVGRKDIVELLKEQKLENIHVAEFEQEKGEEVSGHGSPVYETITTLTDIEIGQKFRHKSFDELDTNKVRFLPLENLDKKIDFTLQQIDKEIEKLNSAIDEKNSIKKNISSSYEFLKEKYPDKIINNVETTEISSKTELNRFYIDADFYTNDDGSLIEELKKLNDKININVKNGRSDIYIATVQIDDEEIVFEDDITNELKNHQADFEKEDPHAFLNSIKDHLAQDMKWEKIECYQKLRKVEDVLEQEIQMAEEVEIVQEVRIA